MPDDTRAPHWTWLVAGALAALIVTVYARIDRARRAWRRARAALGVWLIDAGDWLMPDPPLLDDPAANERMMARLAAALEQERQRQRRNGHTGSQHG